VSAATVFVLVPSAVYDHGVVGVYETEEEARRAAVYLWPKTDGHHAFIIVPRKLGATHPDVFNRAMYPALPLATGPPRILMEDEARS
jgi:hypothetical protein